MSEKQKLTGPVRDKSPCDGCTERFLACHDHCPKDERGAFGHKAFKEQIAQIKAARRNYDMKYNPYFHDYKEDNYETK